MVRGVMVLSVIARTVRGFGGGGAGTMVVIMMGFFLIVEVRATWCIVATADMCRKRGQNWAHTE